MDIIGLFDIFLVVTDLIAVTFDFDSIRIPLDNFLG